MVFESRFEQLAPVHLPAFTGTRIMMMPILIGHIGSIPAVIAHYATTLLQLANFRPEHKGKVGYITIDEKEVGPMDTHRRGGLHVDGVFEGRHGPWGGGGWGSAGNGMITVASHVGCRAWHQQIEGEPGRDGECDHIADQLGAPTYFQPHMAYWVDGLCVHESIPQLRAVKRQFVRLSMPSTAPWFEGYDVNPLGIQPTGPILPRRQYMDA